MSRFLDFLRRMFRRRRRPLGWEPTNIRKYLDTAPTHHIPVADRRDTAPIQDECTYEFKGWPAKPISPSKLTAAWGEQFAEAFRKAVEAAERRIATVQAAAPLNHFAAAVVARTASPAEFHRIAHARKARTRKKTAHRVLRRARKNLKRRNRHG